MPEHILDDGLGDDMRYGHGASVTTPPLTRITELEAINAQLARQVRRLTEGLRQRIELLQALVRDRPPETEGRDTYADGVTAGAIAALQIVNDTEARALLSASPSDGGGAITGNIVERVNRAARAFDRESDGGGS